MRQSTTDFTLAGIAVGMIVLGLAIMVFSAHMEAATYNRLTGSDVTTWEALFVNLRIDCGS